MITLTNNLFPPIVPDVIPSFIRTSTCKLYFSLSIYNVISDIKKVQISLTNQRTNLSALKNSLYPSGIKIADIIEDENATDDFKYYVEIAASDLQGNQFQINQFYLSQIRFISKDAPDPPSSGIGIATWLAENIEYFSEWSKICVLKGIQQPQITLNNLNGGSSVQTLEEPLTQISGRLYYNNTNEQEYLSSYNIIFRNAATEKIYYQTEEIYTNLNRDPNEINYQLIYQLPEDTNCQMILTYTTNNLYSQSLVYLFKIAATAIRHLDLAIVVKPEEQNGRMKIDLDFQYGLKTRNNLIIKRSSYKTNFLIWETLKYIPHTIDDLRHIWYDTTIEHGVWYKYRIQQDGGKKKFLDSEKVLCNFEDIFLVNAERQLRIKFNPTISGFKYNTMESQQVTLGSQFPFVKRNGNNFYRSFSISGLITSFMDDNEWNGSYYIDNDFHSHYFVESFTNKKEIYSNFQNEYDEYNLTHKIDKYNDYIYEREFRDAVIAFLYQDNIKLFKSPTEGNILIRLMDISLEPVNQLGRRLYSFSANAIEIDINDIKNQSKYNILNKYFYSYKVGKILGYNEYNTSIIDEIKTILNSQDLIKVVRLNIQNNIKDMTLSVKTSDEDNYHQYVAEDAYSIDINYEQFSYFIEDAQFLGIALAADKYQIINNEYYNSTDQIKNPVANGVYYILKDESNMVDHYVTFDPRKRMLTTYDEEVLLEDDKDYDLFVKRYYDQYIYYNGAWRLFQDGSVNVPFSSDIEYYYEIKGEN